MNKKQRLSEIKKGSKLMNIKKNEAETTVKDYEYMYQQALKRVSEANVSPMLAFKLGQIVGAMRQKIKVIE